jgi:Common central domain of tyrosinase
MRTISKIPLIPEKGLDFFNTRMIYYQRNVFVTHGNVHVEVGGDMASVTAARDPLFYLHHSFIDYEWSKCQVAWGSKYPQVGGLMYDTKTTPTMDTMIPFYDNEFGDVLDISNMCVRYAALGERRQAQPSSSSALPVTTTTNANAPVITTVTNTTVSANNSSNAIGAPATFALNTTTSVVTNQTSPPPSHPVITTFALTTTTIHESVVTHQTTPPPSHPVITTFALTTTTFHESVVTPQKTPPPPPSKVDTCPPPLPEAWIIMNNLNRADIESAAAECKKIVAEVSKGKTFVPAPNYLPKESKEILAKVLPKNYVINPPSKPRLTAKPAAPKHGAVSPTTVPHNGASFEPPSASQPSASPLYTQTPNYVSGSGRSQIYMGLVAVGVAFLL